MLIPSLWQLYPIVENTDIEDSFPYPQVRKNLKNDNITLSLKFPAYQCPPRASFPEQAFSKFGDKSSLREKMLRWDIATDWLPATC